MAYHTSATTKGGRNGRAELDTHGLALAMALPKDLGGSGEGHNPEQLFALGYSACFNQAVIALGRNHARMLNEMGVPANRIRLLRSFDPRAGAHAPDVEDPYYGAHADFEETFAVIEASLPGLHDWVDEQLADRGLAS